MCTRPWVPRKGFPLIFHGVLCRHSRTSVTTSLFNKMEVNILMTYIQELCEARVPQSSVGIVSPYRRQVRMIKERLQVS